MYVFYTQIVTITDHKNHNAIHRSYLEALLLLSLLGLQQVLEFLLITMHQYLDHLGDLVTDRRRAQIQFLKLLFQYS